MNATAYLVLTVAIMFVMTPLVQGANLLKKEFEGATINTVLWQVTSPGPDSTVSVEPGAAVFKNGGTLTTIQELPEKFELYGSLDFTGSDADAFEIIIRTDGKLSPSGEPLNGVRLKFLATEDARSVNFKTAIIDLPASSATLVATNFNQSSRRSAKEKKDSSLGRIVWAMEY